MPNFWKSSSAKIRSDQPQPAIKVALSPAWKGLNSYNAMFSNSLKDQGLEIIEMDGSALNYSFQADVVVLHWPDEFFVVSRPKSLGRALLMLTFMTVTGIFYRQKILWVVHNVVPHDMMGLQINLLRQAFFKRLNGLIFLSSASRSLLTNRFPEVSAHPYVMIRHGHYRGIAASESTAHATNFSGRPIRLAYVGLIRRYKCPDILAKAAAELPNDVLLSIAGGCSESDLQDELQAITSQSPNITLTIGYMSEAELEQHVDESDAVVLPYRDIVNSGSALFALSRSRPVLAPRLGSLIELQAEVGSEWVYLYDGDLTVQVLKDFIIKLRTESRQATPDLSAHDWTGIGEKVTNFVKAML